MNLIQFSFLLNLLRYYQASNSKYLLVQVDDEKVKKPQLVARGQIEGNIGGRNLKIQSRDQRIIGGREIRPHSEPWLALLCNYNSDEMW